MKIKRDRYLNQLIEHFEKLLNGLNRDSRPDLYGTGSNSRFHSSDTVDRNGVHNEQVPESPTSILASAIGRLPTLENSLTPSPARGCERLLLRDGRRCQIAWTSSRLQSQGGRSTW